MFGQIRALIARLLGNRASFIADSTARWIEKRDITFSKRRKRVTDRRVVRRLFAVTAKIRLGKFETSLSHLAKTADVPLF
jgi:hypothetical protein